MRPVYLVLSAATVLACGRGDEEAVADSPAAATMALTLSPADVAGHWSINLVSEASDSTLATYELNANADASTWTLTPPGREPIPVRSALEGDSLLLDAGPFKATTPANVDMTMHSVSRLEGGMLVGTFVSQYALAGGDSIVRGRLRGTRRP